MAHAARSGKHHTPSKFGWTTHPLGIHGKILAWLVAQRLADARGCRVVQVSRGALWAEVTRRLPDLPRVWEAATGRLMTPDLLWNRVYYMFRTHQRSGPGPLVEGVSAEHPTRSARLKPYVASVRALFESYDGALPRELAEWACSEPAPSADEVRARVASLAAPPDEVAS
jgi:hypothetical protein